MLRGAAYVTLFHQPFEQHRDRCTQAIAPYKRLSLSVRSIGADETPEEGIALANARCKAVGFPEAVKEKISEIYADVCDPAKALIRWS